MININLLSITNFNYLLTAAIFALICFCHVFGLAFLLSLNFLFTRGYYISTRVEIFHINAIFFNSVYRVEISTRNENLHIISPFKYICDIKKQRKVGLHSYNKFGIINDWKVITSWILTHEFMRRISTTRVKPSNFTSVFQFYGLWKYQKTSGFLIFSERVEIEY